MKRKVEKRTTLWLELRVALISRQKRIFDQVLHLGSDNVLVNFLPGQVTMNGQVTMEYSLVISYLRNTNQ